MQESIDCESYVRPTTTQRLTGCETEKCYNIFIFQPLTCAQIHHTKLTIRIKLTLSMLAE
jgi:hypothetical protein